MLAAILAPLILATPPHAHAPASREPRPAFAIDRHLLLVDRLGCPRYGCRESAATSLGSDPDRVGAYMAARWGLGSPDLEVRRRCGLLLAAFTSAPRR